VSSMMQLLRRDERLRTFSTALELSSLSLLVDEERPVTVLAPTNLAFSRLGDEKLLQWFQNPQLLSEVLRHHLVSGRLEARDLIRMRIVRTFGGGLVRIKAFTDHVKVGEASMENCDIKADNGVLHLLDRVLQRA